MKNYLWCFLVILFTITLHSQSLMINEIVSSNSIFEDEDGDTPDWIELYNSSSSTINLNNYSISDDPQNLRKWIFPSININPDEYLIVFASDKDKSIDELHTNFKISASGEEILLVDNYGFIVDQVWMTAIPPDYSLGRNMENNYEWLVYQDPTPGGANTTLGFASLAPEPLFSIEGGFYETSVELEISTLSESATVYYTLDGSDPDQNANVFTNPISLNSTTVVRARVYEDELLPSRIITKTYFIGETFSLPVVSLSTNSENFFDDEIGIYVEGTNGIIENCTDYPANWNQDWERPIHIEFYEKNGSLGFSIDAGVKIYGGCSRRYPQKSLEINARGEYGSTVIPYKIFDDLPFEEFNSIVLRNSGNDYYRTFIRDAVSHQLSKELDIDIMSYKPAIVFLNGQYWGIHNMRERTENDYIEQHHGVDKDNLDIIRNTHRLIQGDTDHYEDMITYFKTQDLSIDSNFEYVNSLMEMQNYIDYMILEMFIANTDWFPANMKFWRPKTADGRWRWILFDTDYGFGLSDPASYTYNMFNVVKDEEKYPANIFNGLIQNNKFINMFVNSYADKINTIFKSEKIIEIIDSFKTIIELEMPRHISRWTVPSSISKWETNIQVLRNFAAGRTQYMKGNFLREFGIDGMANLNLEIDKFAGGYVRLNSIKIKDSTWTGEYFVDIPVMMEAIPNPGYSFVEWSGDINSSEEKVNYIIKSSNNITANFRKNSRPADIVINEINYNSNPDFEVGDWIELYNNGGLDVDISSWYFVDEESENVHKFLIPEGTVISNGAYLVLAENLATFSNFFPDIDNVVGDFGAGEYGFGLSGGGEPIRLYSSDRQLVDTVEYDDKLPWPEEADGGGPTLELKNPSLNNLLVENWTTSSEHGSPGRQNGAYESSNSLELQIKVFLEGSYNSTEKNMFANLTENNVIPLEQPYSISPWNYDGIEEVVNIPDDAVDWILVEIRSADYRSRKAGFLLKNGSIVELDGISNLIFNQVPAGEYRLVIFHRNHLSTISDELFLVE